MKIIVPRDLDLKAGTYTTGADLRYTVATVEGDESELTIDFQLAAPPVVPPVVTDPPPVIDPPADADPPVDPPPADVPPPVELPPPPPVKAGTHAVRVESIIDGVTWFADAVVGEDPQAAGQFKKLTDADGNIHPGMRAYFYADCCDVGAVNGRVAIDYSGSLTITYDGTTVYDAHAVLFPWRALNQTIRYGKFQPTWAPVDPSLFPNYAKPAAPLPPKDLTRYDWSYNGMGCASYAGMGTTGSRGDIAFVPEWDVPMVLESSDEAYAVTRKVADWSGQWKIYAIDDDTGQPFDITTYPNTTFIAYSQARYVGNPIAEYKGTSPTPFKWDEAHHTGYNFVAAAATMSARDRFHAGVWANAALMAYGPQYRQSDGVWAHYQERGTAWALRSLFLACYLSDRPAYFAARMEEQRLQGERQLTHPLGFQSTYINRVFPDGSKGTAPWEENYTRLVVGVIAKNLPAWGTVNDRLKTWITGVFAQPWWQLATLYTMASHDAKGVPFTTWAQVLRSSLTGASTWTDADITALLQPGITTAQVSALIRKNSPSWPGKDGDFSASYPTSCQDYGAIQTAAVATMCGAGPEWALCQSIPTKPDWASGWQWHVVPS